jgi:hypothetical protein
VRFLLGFADGLRNKIANTTTLEQTAQVAACRCSTRGAFERLRSVGIDRDSHSNRVSHLHVSSTSNMVILALTCAVKCGPIRQRKQLAAFARSRIVLQSRDFARLSIHPQQVSRLVTKGEYAILN